MCVACLGERYKITAQLDELSPEMLMCKACGRWRTSNKGKASGTAGETWAHAELESRELLGICLKQGIEHCLLKNRMTLQDARWEWTEPHSRRLRVRVTVRKHLDELPNGGVTLQAQKTIIFKVNTRQCVECAQDNATGGAEPWRSLVQVRQRSSHKRTLHWLEQQASGGKKSGARGAKKDDWLNHPSLLGVQQLRDGLDFYFADTGSANSFTDWCKSRVPLRSKTSKKLISSDKKSNKDHIKYTTLLEVVPLSRDDCVVVPSSSGAVGSVSGDDGAGGGKKSGGGGDTAGQTPHPLRSRMGPGSIAIVTKVSSVIHFVQVYPPTLRVVEMTAEQYFRCPFNAFLTPAALVPYTILDVEDSAEIFRRQMTMTKKKKQQHRDKKKKVGRKVNAEREDRDFVNNDDGDDHDTHHHHDANDDNERHETIDEGDVGESGEMPITVAGDGALPKAVGGEGEIVTALHPERETRPTEQEPAVPPPPPTPTPWEASYFPRTEAEVARTSDLGSNDLTWRCVTHLSGPMLGEAGDTVLGYDFEVVSSSGAASETTGSISEFDDVYNAASSGGGKGRSQDQSSAQRAALPSVVLVRRDVKADKLQSSFMKRGERGGTRGQVRARAAAERAERRFAMESGKSLTEDIEDDDNRANDDEHALKDEGTVAAGSALSSDLGQQPASPPRTRVYLSSKEKRKLKKELAKQMKKKEAEKEP